MPTATYTKAFFRKKAIAGDAPGPPLARFLIEDWTGAWCVKALHEAEMSCLPKIAYERIYWVQGEERWRAYPDG